MNLENVLRLFDYNVWANHRTIDGCDSLNSEQFLEPLGGSFGSVRNTVAHIMDVEWLYLERWQGRAPTTFPKAEYYPDLSHIRERWWQIEQDTALYLKNLSQEDLASVIEFRNTKGILYRHSLWEVMQHLVNHSTYHRGQVTTLLRQLGAAPKSSDLIAFYREKSGQPVS